MRSLFKYVGLRHLRVRPVRTILTTLGIGLGITLWVAIQAINKSTLASFKENVDAVAGKANLIISAGMTGFDETKIDEVLKIEGVAHAVPMIESRAYFAGREKSRQNLTILGVDLLKEQGVRTYKTSDQDVIEDPLVFLNQPDSIIVTTIFAKTHNLKIDSPLELATAYGKKRFVVRGLLQPEGPAKAFGGSLAIMDIDGARFTFGKEGKLDRIDIVAKEEQNLDELAERIKGKLGPGYKVERPSQQSEGMERMVQSYQIMLSFFGLLALLVGLFLVTNSVSIAVAERRREIGTLRALGAPRRSILWLFVSEALFIGIVGSIIGVGLGRILAESMLDEVSRSISTQYLTTIKTNRIIFEWKTIVEAMFLGTTAAVAAAFLPSWKATRIHPLEAMKKTEVVESGSNLFNWSTILGLFILAYYTLSMKLEWFAIHKVFDLLNNISSMVGPALVGPVLVTILILIFKKIFSRTWGTVTRLSADNLVRNPRRTASNVTTLMVGLVLVTTISALNISFKQTIVGWFSKVLYPDFLISAQGNLITYQTQPVHESLAQEIDKIPGVKIASNGGAHAVRFIHFQYEGKQLGMKNFDEPDPDSNYSIFDVKDRDPIVAGKELYHSSEPTVMVSQNFVLHFGKKTGDVMTIATPTGPVDFKIVGVVVDFASPEGIIYQSRQSFKKIWNDHLVDAFGIKVAHGFDSEVVRANLEKVLGPKNLMITSNFELRNQIVKSVDQSFAYTKAIEAAALMVAALGLLNTFLISIMERKRELGMLRAIGMARSQMTSMILKEAAIQGALGAIVAVAFGTWISSMWISGSLAHALGWIIEFTFPWEGVIKTVGVGVLVTLVAGVYPAWKAATSEIREALEYE